MPFSFLNPWFWLGVAAVAAPLWLHLRRKKETGIIYFSALRFLEDQPEPKRSPLRLRHIFLFAVRVFALLLIISALAWPYLRQKDTIPIKESRVYILDNTLSHQAEEGFERDRLRILNEFGKVSSDTQIAVIELTATPRVVVSFGDQPQAARLRVQQLQPSFQRGSYLAAFRQAEALLSNSLGQKKRIVLLGDNQQNQWNENVNTPPFLRNIELELPRHNGLILPNLALSEPRVQRIFLGEKSLVNFTAKLSHVGDSKVAQVILRANGQEIFSRSVNLEHQPQTILLQAQWEADHSVWLRGEITVQGSPDALAGDNRAYFSLPPVQEGKVALLAQSQYLRLALSPEIMRGQWATRIIAPTAISSELASTDDADVLCLESNYLQSSDARKLLWRYLSNSRGVILLVNRITPAIKNYLRELGFEAEDTLDSGKSNPTKFQFVSFNHSIFHPFLSPDYGNLMEVRVTKYAPLKADQAMPLIFSEQGTPLFFQSTKFAGKFFVTAFGLDRDQTSWPIHQSFIPFLDLILQAARAEDPTPTTLEPGEMNVVQLPGSTTARELVLSDETRELSRVVIEHGRGQVRMPDKPGLYSLTYDDKKRVERVFSVNPSPKESELVYVDSPDAVTLWSVNTGARTKTAVSTSVAKMTPRAILQQRLWWWMMLGGLLALFAEMLLTETRKRA